MDKAQLFEDVVEFPDPQAAKAYNNLVGLDDHKRRLVKEATLLLDPDQLEKWSSKHHGKALPVIDQFRNRPPLFILAGDVGCGKSALARTFGNEVASQTKLSVMLFALSLGTRGSGAVGEMTQLITRAFDQVRGEIRNARAKAGKASRAAILLIDEADALAQSRAETQMHHEDRNGVNALIRGIDALAEERLPVIVIMCTNRGDAIDPAVQRRAAAVLPFNRPNENQRLGVLTDALSGTGIEDDELVQLAKATGPSGARDYGYTYSDLTQRLVPSLVLDAFPDKPLSAARALEIANSTPPTPPFTQFT